MSSNTTRKAPKALGLLAAGLLGATAMVAVTTVVPVTPATAQNQLQARSDRSHQGLCRPGRSG
jgi:hypothetical protein